jgi:hypothetical protein
MKSPNYKVYFLLIIILISLFLFFYLQKNIRENFQEKKRIAFCISGQVRDNSCVSNSNDENMREYWDKYIFNEYLKNNYDYDIFISCDKNINIEKTKEYFGKNLKNIHIINNDIDTGYYMREVNNKIPSFKQIVNNNSYYINNPHNYYGILYQYYKLFDCLFLLKSFDDIYTYDYIVRLRFDIITENYLSDFLEKLDSNNDTQLFAFKDMIAIGRPDIMNHYFSLLPKFGTYDFTKNRHKMQDGFFLNKNDYYNVKNTDWWITAPEFQLSEHIYDYCNKNNLDIDKTVKKFPAKNHYFISSTKRKWGGELIRENVYYIKENTYQ